IAILSSRIATKNEYIRKIYTYGLAFSNFGFMGIPIVSALFPEYEMYYIIFTLPLWTLIYVWGVPNLLIDTGDKRGLRSKLKALVNPMFVSLIIGALIGISGVKLPEFITSVVNTCGSCMSPLAMIITGITFANINIKKVLSDVSIYFVSLLRLIVIPCAFAGIFILLRKLIGFEIEEYYFVCMLCSLAMPLGLNTVVVPAAYGKDTSVAAGMALISHLLSVITIPIILTLFGV
ncbi:MAG: AEC family transporter, partial [Clostridia bacterium]|nr:AEC family transporter [Clostridia bacterium]